MFSIFLNSYSPHPAKRKRGRADFVAAGSVLGCLIINCSKISPNNYEKNNSFHSK